MKEIEVLNPSIKRKPIKRLSSFLKNRNLKRVFFLALMLFLALKFPAMAYAIDPFLRVKETRIDSLKKYYNWLVFEFNIQKLRNNLLKQVKLSHFFYLCLGTCISQVMSLSLVDNNRSSIYFLTHGENLRTCTNLLIKNELQLTEFCAILYRIKKTYPDLSGLIVPLNLRTVRRIGQCILNNESRAVQYIEYVPELVKLLKNGT